MNKPTPNLQRDTKEWTEAYIEFCQKVNPKPREIYEERKRNGIKIKKGKDS
jgi:hypothetical protein